MIHSDQERVEHRLMTQPIDETQSYMGELLAVALPLDDAQSELIGTVMHDAIRSQQEHGVE